MKRNNYYVFVLNVILVKLGKICKNNDQTPGVAVLSIMFAM